MQTTIWQRPCGSPPSGPQHDVARRRAGWTGCVGGTRGRALRERGAPRCKRDGNAQRWEPHLHGPHVADETRRAAVEGVYGEADVPRMSSLSRAGDRHVILPHEEASLDAAELIVFAGRFLGGEHGKSSAHECVCTENASWCCSA